MAKKETKEIVEESAVEVKETIVEEKDTKGAFHVLDSRANIYAYVTSEKEAKELAASIKGKYVVL